MRPADIPAMRTPSAGDVSDAGEIVTGWIIRLVATFAVVGVLSFDGLSMAASNLSVTDTAASAARAASTDYATNRNAQSSYDSALAAATTDNALNRIPVERFGITPEGTVTLTVRREVVTLVLRHLPGSERWLVAEATTARDAGRDAS